LCSFDSGVPHQAVDTVSSHLLDGDRIIVAGGGVRAASSISNVVEVLDTRRARSQARSDRQQW